MYEMKGMQQSPEAAWLTPLAHFALFSGVGYKTSIGTTGGQVYLSSDSGDNWKPIVRDLPAVLSVEVQTLP